MVALPIVFHREFPIAFFDDVHLVSDFAVADAVRKQIRLELSRELVEIGRRLFCKADEQQSRDIVNVNRLQSILRSVKCVAPLRMQQLAASVVCPLMIGTDDISDGPIAFIQQTGAAMSADVVKCANSSVVIPQSDDGIAPEIKFRVVSRLWQSRFWTSENPLPPEDQLHV